LRFRYRLEGLDSGWVEAGARRTAFYNYVPPGEYRFHVIACNSSGVWSESGATLDVVVSHYFWQSWWVLAAGASGILMVVAGGVRMVEKRKLRQRMKRLEQERALERERTRIAQDLHDEMGAKLCRISFLSEHARRNDSAPDELHRQIVSISEASREVLQSLDEIVWAVNPKNDTLEHVASYIGQYAQEYFQMTGLECEADVSTQVPPEPMSSQARHHLFLAVHEAFTNVLKHARASRCCLVINCDGNVFEIIVSDNGAGISEFLLCESPNDSPSAAGEGLRNMRRRMTAIGGTCEITSTPGSGTNVRFTFPVHSRFNAISP